LKDVLRLAGYTRRYWYLVAVSVVLMAVMGLMTSVRVLLIKEVPRILNPTGDPGPEKLFTVPVINRDIYLEQFFPQSIHNVFTTFAIAVIVVFLIRGVCDYLGDYVTNFVGLSIVTDLRNEVFSKLLRHGGGFFAATSTGQVMSSVMSDIERVQTACSDMFADMMRQSFSALGLLIVVFATDWKLALFSLALFPFVLLPTAKLGRKIRRSSRSTQDSVGDLNQVLQEAISGHQVVKAFGAEKYEFRRFRSAATRLLKTNMRKVMLQGIPSPFIELMGAVTFTGLLWYGREEIKAHALNDVDFAAFLVALLFLYEPVKRLTNLYNLFQQAIGASEKVFAYLDQPEEIVSRAGARRLEGFREALVFDRVKFRYPGAQGLQIEDVSLHIRPGEIVALVGASGAGKTTLASMLPRFIDALEGSVKIDGVDVRDLTLDSLRKQISLVAQDTFLFNDTVARNIAYGEERPERERIEKAARAAHAHEFIEEMPEGYKTVIGDRGVKLSGGQRQRLSIARALYRNSPILILDEATSHLDTESEMLVQKALGNLMSGRTVIVIAHRISTIRRADKIVVMEQGRIAEIGNHDELMVQGGIYHRLHELQNVDWTDA
jgi:subfamily B ATP-binding cassette protein MsbA